ncbi:MAG: AI-2E family transporter [Phenylobacterium sp.]|nr:AI-2E family transporter [Phenylobacterium sp.]
MTDRPPSLSRAFVRRTWLQFGIAVFIFVCWQLADVFLLAFGAVIVAVLLRSIADPIRDRTPLGDGASLALSGILVLSLLGLAGWLFGSTITSQVSGLADRIPRSGEELRELLSTLPFGETLGDQVGNFGALASQLQGAAGRISGYAMNLAGAATNLLLVLFAGVYLAIRPGQARDGLLMLLPNDTARPVKEAMDTSGRALRLWLLGTLADMTIVGVMTGIGTALIGLPSPVALGLFAGIVSFVPIVGPIVSVIPGVLLALQLGPEMVLWTLLVYFAVQQIESNLFYPFIQRRAVDLPPVLTLFGVLGFGLLLGPLGVIFATPLLVVLMVFTKMLYVRNTLGRDVEVPGERKADEPSGA